MSATQLKNILDQYRQGLSAQLGDELVDVILYGSHARGDAHARSDIDVLCVVREPFDYARLMEKTSELTAKLSLENDVVLSRTFVTLEDYETRQLPFLMNVRNEGVRL